MRGPRGCHGRAGGYSARVSALDFLDDELATLSARGRRRVERVVTARAGAEVVVDGRTLVNFASNDYLGLALDPRLAAAASAAEAAHGTGAGASRLISGHTGVTVELERALASWLDVEAVRVFNSGYAANTGLIASLAGPGDVILSDERNHASLIDGCRLARAQVAVYRHGDLADLERRLATIPGRRRFVVTESVFSMDGDCPDLDQLVALAHRHGAAAIVDDAHALGVLSASGRGLGVAAGADVVVATLGKSVGAAGAFVAGTRSLADFLWNRARTLIFSTGLTTGTQAAALEGVRIASGAEGDARRARLREHVARLGGCEAAIIPVVLGDDRAAVAAASRLESMGFWVPAIRPPTVAEGTSRLRVTVSAAHASEQVAALATALELVPR